jgi:hypothetical protein
VIVIVDVVRGVDPAVEMVTVVEHVGEQDDVEKVACAPAGRPDAVKVTALVEPAVWVAVTGFDTDAPRVTDRLPPLARAKSNDDAATVRERKRVSRIAMASGVRNHGDRGAPLPSRRGKGPPESREHRDQCGLG